MWPYWMLFLLPAATALLGRNPTRGAEQGTARSRWGLGWLIGFVGITLMVGLRERVGGDWGNYLRHLEMARQASFMNVLVLSDPGYALANWLSVQLDWGIYGVNLICALLFSIGLIRFCRSLPRPWLALAVAVPYMVLVLGMGYSRQGVALGISLLGLLALQKRNMVWFVFWVLLGATFHKTAVLLLPLAALGRSRNRYWTIAWVAVVTLVAYVLLLAESVDAMIGGYLESRLQSEGAILRLAMNALPAAILLINWKRFEACAGESAPLWRWFAIFSLILLGVLYVSPSSTVIDRIALYFLPLQLVVFSHLPNIFGNATGRNRGLEALVILYYAAVLFVWLNFATNARLWLPYRFFPFEGLS